jgi:hypothetical protein
MDTHVADAALNNPSAFQARLPGEPNPHLSGAAGEPPLRAGERPSPSEPKRKRKSGLLSGVAIIAVVVIGAGGFLISPYNTFVPVPPSMKLAGLSLFHFLPDRPKDPTATASNKVASMPGSSQAAPGAQQPAHVVPAPPLLVTDPDVLAPSASLASVKPPAPPATVVQPAFQPTSSQAEVAELEGFQAPATEPSVPANPTPSKPGLTRTAKPSSAGSSPHPVEAPKPAQVASQAFVSPPGYVPHEPGAGPQTPSPSPHSPAQTGKAAPPAHNAVVVPVVAKPPAPPAAQTHPAAPLMQQVDVDPTQSLSVAPKLQAAPLSDTQQVQVLELVTQLATLIGDERTQISNMQADEYSGNKAMAAKMSDFERRLALVEADQALASASATPASPVQPAAAQLASSTSVALAKAKAALSAASSEASVHPVIATAAPASVQPVTPALYHVQAASPGLAMLAEVDHSGGDGSEIEVQVGDTIPGYGHVLSVSQQGTDWVVQTDSGLIK